jgi:N6-L-threonylcarbamoyladenine synthase
MSIGLSGGVSQNDRLRAKIGEIAIKFGLPILFAEKKHCGDNASMIAFAAAIDPQIEQEPADICPNLQIC